MLAGNSPIPAAASFGLAASRLSSIGLGALRPEKQAIHSEIEGRPFGRPTIVDRKGASVPIPNFPSPKHEEQARFSMYEPCIVIGGLRLTDRSKRTHLDGHTTTEITWGNGHARQ